MAKDFSIIIAHRDINTIECSGCHKKLGNTASSAPLGLWATIHSIESDLEGSGFDYDYSIVVNGVEKEHPDTFNLLWYVNDAKKLALRRRLDEPVAPPLARQMAVEESTGKVLFFFDSHILVHKGYFKRAFESMDKYGMDMLHSTTRFFLGSPDTFHYNLHLQRNFWAEASLTPPDANNPYRIAAGGHGGFVVPRSIWNEVGGYGWEGFKGYGGEEMYFDLKMALLGKNNWLDPKLVHYHYAGNRGYQRHYTDEFFVNMMGVANIIGGSEWMETVQKSFADHYLKMKTKRTIFDLMLEAEEKSRDHAAWMQSKRLRTLDEQLLWFKQNNIAC
jgi:hypothetical protein